MKIINFFISVLAFPAISFGQNFGDSLIESFYNKTLLYYFSDSVLNIQESSSTKTLIQTDFDTTHIIKSVCQNQFKFINYKTPLQSLLTNPSGTNTLTLHSISHKKYGQDTILITIDISTLSDIGEFNYWTFGHTYEKGDRADAKFIYDAKLNSWTLINKEEIKAFGVSRRRK